MLQKRPTAAADKNRHIETVRGIAILIIVAGHVIGIDDVGGMTVSNDSAWRYLYYSVNYLGVSLFTAIAGWVYALKPTDRQNVRSFLHRKVIRLILPMIFVGTLFFCVQYIVPGTNMRGDLSQIWRIYVLPHTIYWYLPSICIIFCVIAFIDVFSLCRSIRSWSIIMAISLAATFIEPYLSSHYLNLFSIWGAICIMPYFLVGVAINRFADKLASPVMKRIYLIGFIISIILIQTSWAADNVITVRDLWFSIFIKVISATFMLAATFKNNILIYFGHYAYTIFLFHVFGTGGGRIILKAIGVHSEIMIFAVAMTMGLVIPIIIDQILSRNRLATILFLGRDSGVSGQSPKN